MDTFYKPPIQGKRECAQLEKNYINCMFQKAIDDNVMFNKCKMDNVSNQPKKCIFNMRVMRFK